MFDCRFEGPAVLPLQTLDQGQPVFHLLQPLRRGVDAVGKVTQRERQVFELGLDAVARIQVRRESRVDGSQLPHPFPDPAEGCRAPQTPVSYSSA